MSRIESALRSPATRANGGRLRAEGGTGRQERSNDEAPGRHPLSGAYVVRAEGAHDTNSLFLPDNIPFPRSMFIEAYEQNQEQSQ
jgi:hypothetical protein